MLGEFPSANAFCDHRNERFACFPLEAVMERTEAGIPFRAVDQSREARRKDGVADYLSNVAHDALKALARRTAREVGTLLVMKRQKCVGDQSEPFRPQSVDRRFRDAGPGSDRFDGECAISSFRELVEGRTENQLARPFDPRIDRFRAAELRLPAPGGASHECGLSCASGAVG